MTITAELVDGARGPRIHLTFGYDPSLVTKAKSVGGGSFSKTGGAHWSFPAEMSVCYRLREVFGSALGIGPSLNAWAAEAKRQTAALADLSAQLDTSLAHIPAVAPALALAMDNRKYQKPASAFIAQARYVCVADQPGLGKTLETMGGIIEAQNTGMHLVSALSTARDTVWARELPRFLGDAAVTYIVNGSTAKRHETIAAYLADDSSDYRFLVVNPEMLRAKQVRECPTGRCDGWDYQCGDKSRHMKWYDMKFPELFDVVWSSITIDESAHNQSALQAESANERKWSQFRTGASLVRDNLNVDTGMAIALSGTPMRGKPRKLWGTLNWLRPDVFKGFWGWAERHFYVEDNGYGKTIGAMRNEESFYKEMAPYMLRRTKAEVLTDLPPKMYGGSLLDPSDPHSPIGVWVEMDGEQKRQYNELIKHGSVDLDGGKLYANGVLAEITRARQFANSAGVMDGDMFIPDFNSNKFDAMVAMLAERGITGNADADGDGKVVIASQFTKHLNLWRDGLTSMGIRSIIITGETPIKNRAELVRQFQEDDEPRVCFINTVTGGVAITLDRADDLFIMDETWIPDDQEQVEDRLHRASRIHNVTIYYIRSLGTIDEGMARNNIAADTLQKRLMDGQRGSALALRLMKGEAA